MNSPKVSVIIPVYNTEEYVEQTVRSIMNQTLREVEIIIINDGSIDGSLAVLEKLAAEEERITLYTQPNRGLSNSRNVGIDLAQGEFIHFMDSDDILEADTYQLCYDRCKAEALDFVIFDADNFGAVNSATNHVNYHRAQLLDEDVCDGQRLMELLLNAGRYRASACLSFIRTAYLRTLGVRFYPNILHEDELFTPQLYLGTQRAGGIACDFFHRRVRADSIMGSRFSERNLTSYMTVLQELSGYAAGHGVEIRKVIGKLQRIILRSVMYHAAALPAAIRRPLAGTLLRHYPCRISYKLLLLLLIKAPLKKLSRR